VELDENTLHEMAEKQADAKIGFKRHLASYLVINGMLIIIWLLIAIISHGDAWFPWFLFPLVGWGIGLFFHAWNTYGTDRTGAKREALIEREMEKLKSQSEKGGDQT
jgi:hypothetical protein